MRIVVLLFFCLCAHADSQKDRDAAALATANAQHLRDLATIDRLIKESASAASTSKNGAAIAKLGNESKDRAATSLAHQEAAAKAAEPLVPKIDALTAKVDAIPPYDYRPIYLAAIPATVAMFAGVVSIVLALIARGTTNQIHALTNSAMTAQIEAVAIARRANATSLKALHAKDPTKDNEVLMDTAERVAVEAEQRYDLHQQTQNALNRA